MKLSLLLEQVCWTSLQSDQNLRGPRVARVSSSYRSILMLRSSQRRTSAANSPAAAVAIDRRDRRTTDNRPFRDAYRMLCGPRNNKAIIGRFLTSDKRWVGVVRVYVRHMQYAWSMCFKHGWRRQPKIGKDRCSLTRVCPRPTTPDNRLHNGTHESTPAADNVRRQCLVMSVMLVRVSWS